MQPEKAREIIKTLTPLSSGNLPPFVYESAPGSRHIFHDGYSVERHPDEVPGTRIQVTTRVKPTIRERMGREARDPQKHVDKIVDALGKLGYLASNDGNGEAYDDPYNPQLSLHEGTAIYRGNRVTVHGTVPAAEYDPSLGKTAITVVFNDENPQI